MMMMINDDDDDDDDDDQWWWWWWCCWWRWWWQGRWWSIESLLIFFHFFYLSDAHRKSVVEKSSRRLKLESDRPSDLPGCDFKTINLIIKPLKWTREDVCWVLLLDVVGCCLAETWKWRGWNVASTVQYHGCNSPGQQQINWSASERKSSTIQILALILVKRFVDFLFIFLQSRTEESCRLRLTSQALLCLAVSGICRNICKAWTATNYLQVCGIPTFWKNLPKLFNFFTLKSNATLSRK